MQNSVLVAPERVYDIHSHINPYQIGAGNLKNILSYHYLVSEMCSVGGPVRELRMSAPETEWMNAAMSHISKIRNTSSYLMARMILWDLYDIDIDEINHSNWREFDGRIRAKYENPQWQCCILTEFCKIQKIITAYPTELKPDTPCRELFALEEEDLTDFGAVNDNNLVESLKRAIGKSDISAKGIRSHLRTKMDKCLADGVAAFGIWAGRYAHEDVSDSEVDAVIRGETDRDIIRQKLGSFQIREVMEYLAGLPNPPVARFLVGAHAAIGDNDGWAGRIFDMVTSDILYSYHKLFDQYPGLKLCVIPSNSARSRELDNIARFCPNLSVAGNWLHTMYANQITRMMSDRLEFLPVGKIIGFFSDAYNAEWIYGKLMLSKICLGNLIAEKLEQGWWTEAIARDVPDTMYWENPARLYGA